jgi:dynein heavy chain
MAFEKIIEEVTIADGKHADPMFLRKVVELGELLQIRHCVFTMGPPGAGKSSAWKILAKANDKDGQKTTFKDINPKVANSDELYGFISMATREWKDGLLSNIMRALGQIEDEFPKWIVFDGDLDATWIESMNSVMDDNKLLTLASNERIPLKGHMKMIFEIRDLRFATPATVSRAGILFISDADGYQWRAYVKSWIMTVRGDAEVKKDLEEKFARYMPETLNHVRKYFKHIIPQVQISMVMSVCKLIQSILEVQEVKGTALEQVFVFAVIWCVGGGFTEKDGKDYRKEFSNWWKGEFRAGAVKFQKTVYDYYVDIEQQQMVEWTKLPTPDITIDTSRSISSYTIPTVDTISFQFLMRKFMSVKHSPILVGQAGCGKTQIIKGMLNDLVQASDDYIQQIINFNYYTDANLLQNVLQQQVEKKAGTRYGPPGKYKLVYFLDDLNMPCPDKFDTQSAIALLRQHKDYEHWYDKQKILIMQVTGTQSIASMNPNAGSFTINPRLQRHFWLLAVGMPENASLSTIYSAYLTKHFSRFKASILEQIPFVIKATLQLHSDVTITKNFRKTATNFHYEFNVRHLTNVFQGILNARPEAIKEPDNLVRLWVHEAERIYGDRLVSATHLAEYRELSAKIAKSQFPKYSMAKYFGATPEPLIFANFVGGLDEKLYDQFPSTEALSKMLNFALSEYNDVNAVMPLVLFEDAMKHACKISRIIAADTGHALLVGVGGSGKQSLSRLSSFICSFTTVSIMISSTYGMGDLKADLQKFYMKAGVRDEGLMFLFTEGQITNEKFLVYFNDLLSSGEIADLFAAEDIDGIMNSVRAAVKGEGMQDSKDNCMNFFYNRVRKNLHMALCFSPVGDGFRTRSTRFPAIVTCTVIDWFHPWPKEALLSVAHQFLAEVEIEQDEIREGVVNFMPFSFEIVDKYSDLIMQ